jgi:endogenous inhibitor of DNA gyrase (YacG/DUF329 family)
MEDVPCPKCGQVTELECDNSCGTFHCEQCELDFFQDYETGKIVIGHVDDCGEDA